MNEDNPGEIQPPTAGDRCTRALNLLGERLSRPLIASLEACVHCGICAESCHYYVSDPTPQHIPAYRAEGLRRLYRSIADPLGKIAPRWVGARPLDEEALSSLRAMAFGTCTMCGRCVINCPMGVDTRLIVRTARGILAEVGLLPQGLKATLDMHCASGNNMGVGKEDYVETLQWMEEELQSELEDPNLKIPIDKPHARVVFTFNPREVKYFPYLIQAAAKIFNAAGEDWTVSTESWDATNYALFAGDDAAARLIAGNLEHAVNRLAGGMLVMTECGHGYRSQRWEAENWLGHAYPFPVMSFIELQALYIREGRLKLDPAANPGRITYHDPCNQARNGGIVEEPRYILRHVAQDFVEMEPHGIENYCCGGGGGLLAMSEFSKSRLAAGKAKADQIAATGAQLVATSCHNCLDQLTELNKHYKLGVKVQNLSELVANAIIYERHDA